MFTIVRRFIFSLVVAHWMYAEAVLLVPETRPFLDTVNQFLKAPTHDKWIETYRAIQYRKDQLAARFDFNNHNDNY